MLFALDLLARKQWANSITLEPASEEDLETEVQDEPSALTQTLINGSKKLVIQCKRRTTGPWTHGDLSRLLSHGKKRKQPRERLNNDPKVHYLLVTSADLQGVTRDLAVTNHNQWDKLKAIPRSIAKSLFSNADGRVAVWHSLNEEMIDSRIEKCLIERFRVPYSKLQDCVQSLEQDALSRMRGAGDGVWTREQIIQTLSDHGGTDSISDELKDFVAPSNWNEIQHKMNNKNAVLITGQSGTGKTTAAKALISELCKKIPSIRHEYVRGGPEQIRGDKQPGPVVYEIEDPWGKYQLSPNAQPWNDTIKNVLATASPDRQFIVTSRSDILKQAELKEFDQNLGIRLEESHYSNKDRERMFENRLTSLSHEEQATTLKYKQEVMRNLFLPLEIDRFFSGVSIGPNQNENSAAHMQRCIKEASADLIKTSIVTGVDQRESWSQAAIVWVLLKTRKNIPYDIIDEIEWELTEINSRYEDTLVNFVDFLITGRNLKQNNSILSISHPRVEEGLMNAALQKPKQASRAISNVVMALLNIEESSKKNWWLETAVNIAAVTSDFTKLKLKISRKEQSKIDVWLEGRLGSPAKTFREDLKLAVRAGSKDCAVAEVARWLIDSQINNKWYHMTSWKEPVRSSEWYQKIRSAPDTYTICKTFIEREIGYQNASFHGCFHKAIKRLSIDSFTPSFLVGLKDILHHGYNPNVKVLIDGAIEDLVSYESIVKEAIEANENMEDSRKREDTLALYNHDYDTATEEHYSETIYEDAYTANEIIEAYVDKIRQSGNWQKLANHPSLASILWTWIDQVSKDQNVSELELVSLANASKNHKHEDRFWATVEVHFTPKLEELLIKRLVSSEIDQSARANVAKVAIKHAPKLIEKIFSKKFKISNERLLEVSMSLVEGLQGNKTSLKEIEEIFDNLMPKSETTMNDAVFSLIDTSYKMPNSAVINLFKEIPEDTQPELNLAISKVLCKADIDTSNRLTQILTNEFPITIKNIALVEEAMELAVAHDYEDLISVGLQHEFADCRVVAMKSVAAKSQESYPPELLTMHQDTSSSVRTELIELLQQKKHPAHIDTLLQLVSDTWSDESHPFGYDDNPSYPIAERASNFLLHQENLSSEQCDRLTVALKQTSNIRVRSNLLQSIIRFDSKRRQKVLRFAVQGDNQKYSLLSAQSLFFEHSFVEQNSLDQITYDVISSVRPDIACWLMLLVAAKDKQDHLDKLARTLVTNKDRKVILAIPYLYINGEDGTVLENLLSKEFRKNLIQLLETNNSKDLSFLDEEGNVRSVEAVKNLIRIFIPKEK